MPGELPSNGPPRAAWKCGGRARVGPGCKEGRKGEGVCVSQAVCGSVSQLPEKVGCGECSVEYRKF